jgi:hypothetical protein
VPQWLGAVCALPGRQACTASDPRRTSSQPVTVHVIAAMSVQAIGWVKPAARALSGWTEQSEVSREGHAAVDDLVTSETVVVSGTGAGTCWTCAAALSTWILRRT